MISLKSNLSKPLKKFIFAFLLVFPSLFYGQKIEQIFKMLPDSTVMGLTRKERKKICSDGGKIYSFGYIEDIDSAHHYLSIRGKFEGEMVLRSWNVSPKKKLIAVYISSCGPVCSVEQLDFFLYDGKRFTMSPTESLFQVSEADFYLSSASESEMEKENIIATLLFELPKEGNTILVKWGNEEEETLYKSYGKGNRLQLIFENGKFKKELPYWE
jgi:hypothetical protein